MRRAKSIDELYEEVKDFDIVLCNDAPLMTALNNRIDRPRIGTFATTPRYLARKESVNILGEGIWNDLRIISYITEETGYDMRFVHGEVENIRLIRRYTKEVEKYLYGRSRKIYRIFKELPTEEKVMESFDAVDEGLFCNARVAIIGLELFNDLDKHFIPREYDEIDPLIDDEYDIDVIYEEGNDRQIADDAVDLITEENAKSIALVLDSESPLADAVRSALYRKRIPFKNSLPARDLMQLRDYLEMLDMSMSYDTVKAGGVREIFSACGGNIPLEYDDYRLNKIDDRLDARSRELTDAMRNVRTRTFKEFCDLTITAGDKRRDNLYRAPIKAVLGSLGVSDEPITEEGITAISYVINNMEPDHNEEIPDDEKDGVILTDCGNSVYVDRPIVMYLGLGPEWYRPPQGKKYIDWEDERERNALRFNVLLQQGSERIHIVNAMRNGKPARPCMLFDDLIGKVKTFNDVAPVRKGGWSGAEDTDMLKKEPMDVEIRERMFTKSSFNQYVSCPTRFMLSSLVRMPDSEASMFGTIVHELAEFCICYPEIAEKNGPAYYADILWEEHSKMASDERRHVDRCRVMIAFANIMQFRKGLDIEVPLDTPVKDNPIMRHHGLTMTSSITEASLHANKAPLYGRFDLLADGMIVDFKTGRSKKADDVKKSIGWESNVKYPEFQPIVYLTILNDLGSEKKMFRLFNVLGNPEQALSGRPDMDGCFIDMTEKDFNDYVRNDLRHMVGEKHPDLEEGWDEIAERMIFLGPPEPLEKWNDDDALLDIMKKANKGKGVKRILTGIVSSLSGWAASDGTSLVVFQEKIEQFRDIVNEFHRKMTTERMTSFPTNTSRCDDCNYFSICTAAQEAEDELSE